MPALAGFMFGASSSFLVESGPGRSTRLEKGVTFSRLTKAAK